MLEEPLLSILACPIDKGALLYFPEENLLYNPRLRRAYPIESGVPVLLPASAMPVPDAQHERLTRAAQPEAGSAGIAIPVDDGHR
jgi:uncharacterized protein YbaR (Trm112 family)